MNAVALRFPPTPVNGPGAWYFGAESIERARTKGWLSQARINDMVRNIVRPMFEHGLFEDPVSPGAEPYVSNASTPASLRVARTAAAEATVMLKNRRHLLPIDGDSGRTIAVIGWAASPVGATQSTSGGGSSHPYAVPPPVVSPLEGIRAAARANGDRVIYVEGSNVQDAAAAAAVADIAVVVATDASSEAADRTDLGLKPGLCVAFTCAAVPLEQEEMIAATVRANPDSVVVLDVGGPVQMPWIKNAAAVLVPWFGGVQHDNALADIVYGKTEPGGRLPQTFPKSMKQYEFTPQQYPGVGGKAV